MKHGLLYFSLLLCWASYLGTGAEEISTPVEVSPAKSDAPHFPAASVGAGPLKAERLALLRKIQEAQKDGVGIRDYMTAFQNLEGMVQQGAPSATVQQRLESIDRALKDQLSRASELKLPEIPPETGIVGLKYSKRDHHSPEIETVFPGTPADKAQLVRGDVILEVDGVSTIELNKEQIFQGLVGIPGTSVRVKILRGDVAFERILKRTRLLDFGKTHPEVSKLYAHPSRN